MKSKTSNASSVSRIATGIQNSLETLHSSGITFPDSQTTVGGNTAAQQGASQARTGFTGQKFLSWTSFVASKWYEYERDKSGYDEKIVEQLEKYNVCVFFYEDYEGNIKPSWKIEDKETGLCIQNKKLFKYLYKAGQYLDPSMIEVITYDEYQNQIDLVWRRGASYDTGDQYGGILGGTIAGSQYLGQTLKWFNETELGNALQTLGFAYGAY